MIEIFRIPNLKAPESVDVDEQGNLYAGLEDGRIVCVYKSINKGFGLGEIENITSGVIEGAETTDGSVHGRAMGNLNSAKVSKCDIATPCYVVLRIIGRHKLTFLFYVVIFLPFLAW